MELGLHGIRTTIFGKQFNTFVYVYVYFSFTYVFVILFCLCHVIFLYLCFVSVFDNDDDFQLGVIVRDPHHHKSLTCCKQDLNLHRT